MAKTNLRLYDNTRISTFRHCPREFFYRHVMNWSPIPESKDLPSKPVPLIFGSAWHSAMEVVWDPSSRGLSMRDLLSRSFSAWMDAWTENGFPPGLDYEMEEILAPRTPGTAMEMLAAYIELRVPSLEDGTFEVLAVEKPFAVPLDPEDETLFYVGKIDKIVKRGLKQSVSKKVLGIEHKTTTAYSAKGKFRETFTESFSPNSQVDGYLYALHMLFPDEAIGGIWVDAALVHRTSTGFLFIPVERQLSHLDTWLWEVRYWIEQISLNLKLYEQVSPSDRSMAAFPKNTNSCFDFNTACKYLTLCKSWPNPVGHERPRNYGIDVWDPLDHLGPITGLEGK